jgi:mannose-6-phosphate isomerase-like protein (cupin superfamily)
MHYRVARLDEAALAIPETYARHSNGFTRHSLIDRTSGSVHMQAGICQLDAGGSVRACRHAFEKGIYLLAGELELRREGEFFRLSAHDYALLPYGCVHALRNTGTIPARWFEMQAPQPKPPGAWQDTFFEADTAWPERVNAPRFEAAGTAMVGRFEAVNALAPRGDGVQVGLSVYRFMETRFGARSFFMMRGNLAPGGYRTRHDHPIEEFYFTLSGEAHMDIEHERFLLRAGDAAWTGVGASHAFTHVGAEPFRWLETQAPQFPAHYGTRNYSEWELPGKERT